MSQSGNSMLPILGTGMSVGSPSQSMALPRSAFNGPSLTALSPLAPLGPLPQVRQSSSVGSSGLGPLPMIQSPSSSGLGPLPMIQSPSSSGLGPLPPLTSAAPLSMARRPTNPASAFIEANSSVISPPRPAMASLTERRGAGTLAERRAERALRTANRLPTSASWSQPRPNQVLGPLPGMTVNRGTQSVQVGNAMIPAISGRQSNGSVAGSPPSYVAPSRMSMGSRIPNRPDQTGYLPLSQRLSSRDFANRTVVGNGSSLNRLDRSAASLSPPRTVASDWANAGSQSPPRSANSSALGSFVPASLSQPSSYRTPRRPIDVQVPARSNSLPALYNVGEPVIEQSEVVIGLPSDDGFIHVDVDPTADPQMAEAYNQAVMTDKYLDVSDLALDGRVGIDYIVSGDYANAQNLIILDGLHLASNNIPRLKLAARRIFGDAIIDSRRNPYLNELMDLDESRFVNEYLDDEEVEDQQENPYLDPYDQDDDPNSNGEGADYDDLQRTYVQ